MYMYDGAAADARDGPVNLNALHLFSFCCGRQQRLSGFPRKNNFPGAVQMWIIAFFPAPGKFTDFEGLLPYCSRNASNCPYGSRRDLCTLFAVIPSHVTPDQRT